jgi:hypothetical protein
MSIYTEEGTIDLDQTRALCPHGHDLGCARCDIEASARANAFIGPRYPGYLTLVDEAPKGPAWIGWLDDEPDTLTPEQRGAISALFGVPVYGPTEAPRRSEKAGGAGSAESISGK